RRNNDLLAVQQEVSRDEHRALVGHTIEVLVEGPSRLGRTSAPGQLAGRDLGDRIAVFDGPESLVGRIVKVRVEDASALTLFGRVEGLDAATLPARPAPVPRAKPAGLPVVS
ncbi:MAG TPA: TRAM domain-containing protein, partial [bacterium]|nr:TRAM domain-containing protein [bacterium]